MGLSLDG